MGAPSFVLGGRFVPYTEYGPGDVVEIISNNGRRWGLASGGGHGCTGHVAGLAWLLGGPARGTEFPKPTPCCTRRRPCSAIQKLPVKRRSHAFYLTCAAAVLHGAGDWAYTQSIFQAPRIWEMGKLRRVLCLRRRPNKCWADHMKRTGPIVARQLKKKSQPRLQTLAMRRVRIAAWQVRMMQRDAGTGKGLRHGAVMKSERGQHQTVQGGQLEQRTVETPSS